MAVAAPSLAAQARHFDPREVTEESLRYRPNHHFNLNLQNDTPVEKNAYVLT
jgi:hypothetical protein